MPNTVRFMSLIVNFVVQVMADAIIVAVAIAALLLGSGCCAASTETVKPDPAIASASASAAPPPVSVIPIKVTRMSSSSELHASDRNDYSVGRMFDGNRSTAWCEGDAGNGAGTFVELKLNKPTAVETLSMDTGFVKMSKNEGDLFKRNSHVKKLTIHADGKLVKTVDIDANEKSVSITVHRTATVIKITFVEVWPGQTDGPRRAFSDLCITEMELFEGKN